MRVGSRWFPSTQPLPCVAPWYKAAWPDRRSGVTTHAYASNVYCSLLSQAVALDRRRVSWARLQIGGTSCESGAQLQLRAAPLKPLHRYSAPRPKAGLRAWEEPTLPHDSSLVPFLTRRVGPDPSPCPSRCCPADPESPVGLPLCVLGSTRSDPELTYCRSEESPVQRHSTEKQRSVRVNPNQGAAIVQW